ncbi:lysine decarboxylation/transport transcriptional activator CadC [Vibrio sp. ZSDZ65]|uniref:Lysine decarboxylation/transport transcriptional activator CadC n=1 Tax=Vibrio qingdaonensis TaxID=2829491 RepID=A0A9X3HWC5_9VIBR|nr:lysine decarboxylation/transport transcriptional activator CadC [Vibrio qingdaonensis]MCW8346251.1 lysine decarboxylation/transport transcriptional activator CadC [Vibrio qingdaonensis]
MVEVYFQINDWVLSVDENKLYRQDREVSVEPRLVNLLLFLAEHSGQVYCRDELIRYVWDGAIVTDQVVTQSVFELRKILRDGREENLHYVGTVPKRGYKLVAAVTPMTPEQFHQYRTLSAANVTDVAHVTSVTTPTSPPVETQSKALQEPMAFPAAPLTRALYQKKKKPKQPKVKSLFSPWRLGIINAIWIGILVAAVGVFTYKQSEVSITQVIDTHLIAFEYQDGIRSFGRSYELADGFAQKLMLDITRVTDYRVMLHKTAFKTGIVPGKTVLVRVDENDGGDFLELEYRDNSSEKVLFSRQYALANKHLKSVLKQSSLDLMRILKIEDAEQRAINTVSGVPNDPEALALFIRANHYLNVSDNQQFQYAIDLLEQILISEPDNAYVQSELLVAYYVQQALDESKVLKEERLTQLSVALNHFVSSESGPIQPRIYEALSLHETMLGEQAKAQAHLKQALKIRDSVLAYVIKGKHAELAGDLDNASEAYSEAFYIDTSVETYLLCENLVFSSNLKQIDHAMYRAVHPSVVRLL